MSQLRAPDREALRLLFDRHSRLVFGIALNTLRDRGEAQDIVQDTFFHLYERAALFDPLKGSAKAWISQVAFHRALDRKAHLRRRGFYMGVGIEFVNDRLLGATDLDREVGAKLDREKLDKALADLSGEQHKTLSLYYFEGLELREIADRLNESLANVRHFYYRGLEQLRKSAFVREIRQDWL